MVTSTERQPRGVGHVQTAAGRGFADELQRLGYEFDHDYGISGNRAEVWVNRKIGRGVLIEWFSLPEAAR